MHKSTLQELFPDQGAPALPKPPAPKRSLPEKLTELKDRFVATLRTPKGAAIFALGLTAVGWIPLRSCLRQRDPAPVLVMFHGYGAGRYDLEPAIKYLATLGLAKNVRTEYAKGPVPVAFNHGWWEAPSDFPVGSQRAIETLRDARGKGPAAVFGFSQGATIALSLAMDHPREVQCVVAIAGPAHPGGWVNRIPDGGSTRFLIAHGKRDKIVSWSASEKLVELMKAKGFDVEFVSHEGDHELPRHLGPTLTKFLNECLAQAQGPTP